jgi:hypothetical protein
VASASDSPSSCTFDSKIVPKKGGDKADLRSHVNDARRGTVGTAACGSRKSHVSMLNSRFMSTMSTSKLQVTYLRQNMNPCKAATSNHKSNNAADTAAWAETQPSPGTQSLASNVVIACSPMHPRSAYLGKSRWHLTLNSRLQQVAACFCSAVDKRWSHDRTSVG